MMEALILPCDISLQQKSLRKLSKMCWGKFALKVNSDDYYDLKENKIKKLLIHKNNVMKRLPRFLNSFPKPFSCDLPKQLIDKVMNGVHCLHQCYFDAYLWSEKCEPALFFSILNPIAAGEYHATYFMNSEGHFDELAWAKKFIVDDDQALLSRFQIACHYCFEEKITRFWNSMKTSGQLPCNGNLDNIKSNYGSLVGLWTFHLENEWSEFLELYSNRACSINIFGVYTAIELGHEYAARYFWSHCSESEKAAFVNNFEVCILSNAVVHKHIGVVYFIYTVISFLERRCSFFCNSSKDWTYDLWSCLLDSPYSVSVINDIFTLPICIGYKFYVIVLRVLANKMKELKNKTHEMIFKVIWNRLKPKMRSVILENGFYINRFLIEMKEIELLEIIIQPLSPHDKERMLLFDLGKGGITSLDFFSKFADYDTMLRYLLLFFTDYDTITKRKRLRRDASSFLSHFINSDGFKKWTKERIPESEAKEVFKVIECLEGSLFVLNLVLEQV